MTDHHQTAVASDVRVRQFSRRFSQPRASGWTITPGLAVNGRSRFWRFWRFWSLYWLFLPLVQFGVVWCTLSAHIIIKKNAIRCHNENATLLTAASLTTIALQKLYIPQNSPLYNCPSPSAIRTCQFSSPRPFYVPSPARTTSNWLGQLSSTATMDSRAAALLVS